MQWSSFRNALLLDSTSDRFDRREQRLARKMSGMVAWRTKMLSTNQRPQKKTKTSIGKSGANALR
jgi:hypothetical protein